MTKRPTKKKKVVKRPNRLRVPKGFAPRPPDPFVQLITAALPLIANLFAPNLPANLRGLMPAPTPGVPGNPTGANPFGAAGYLGEEFETEALARRLDRFKQIEAQTIAPKTPDYMTVLTGWRAWGVDTFRNEWRLTSLGQSGKWPVRKKISARCKSGSAGPHPAPAWDCYCGIWAFKDLENLTSALAAYDHVSIIGTVSLWGRVIETSNGFRAEYAYPSELWLLDDHMEDIGRVYGVPVRVEARKDNQEDITCGGVS
jgi:hypothetical protein